MIEFTNYGPFLWMRYPTNVSHLQNCTDDNRNHVFEALFNMQTLNHLGAAIAFFTYAFLNFRRACRNYIRARLEHRENPPFVYWTSIPHCPWVSVEVLIKLGIATPVLSFALYWVSTYDGTELFDGGVFNLNMVPFLETGTFLPVAAAFSAAFDLLNRFRPWLLPPHWIHISYAVLMLHFGNILVTHSLWKRSLLVAATHAVAIPGAYISSAGFFVASVRPHSWHATAVQCAGLALWAGTFFMTYIFLVISFMIDISMKHNTEAVAGAPCRDFIELHYSVETLELVWYLYQILILFILLSFTIIYMLLARKEDPGGRRHEKVALMSGYTKLVQ